jgi:hypothetical protein
LCLNFRRRRAQRAAARDDDDARADVRRRDLDQAADDGGVRQPLFDE